MTPLSHGPHHPTIACATIAGLRRVRPATTLILPALGAFLIARCSPTSAAPQTPVCTPPDPHHERLSASAVLDYFCIHCNRLCPYRRGLRQIVGGSTVVLSAEPCQYLLAVCSSSICSSSSTHWRFPVVAASDLPPMLHRHPLSIFRRAAIYNKTAPMTRHHNQPIVGEGLTTQCPTPQPVSDLFRVR